MRLTVRETAPTCYEVTDIDVPWHATADVYRYESGLFCKRCERVHGKSPGLAWGFPAAGVYTSFTLAGLAYPPPQRLPQGEPPPEPRQKT